MMLAVVAFAAGAAEVAGVKLEDKTQVESRDLVLNGAGLRKRVVFNVYVIGLYLPEKRTDPAAVLQRMLSMRSWAANSRHWSTLGATGAATLIPIR